MQRRSGRVAPLPPGVKRAVLALQLRAGIRVGHDEFFVVKSRIRPEHQAPGITPFQLHEQLFIFFFQALQDVGIQDDANVVNRVLIFSHDRVERAMHLHARAHGRLDHAAAFAVRTILVDRIAQAFLRALPRHLHQA